jgi:hypothetical protein
MSKNIQSDTQVKKQQEKVGIDNAITDWVETEIEKEESDEEKEK